MQSRQSFDYDYDEYADYAYYEGEIFRDYDYHERPKVIRNPRDHRFFPGIVPAGIGGMSPKLLKLIQGHVNQVSYYVQGPHRPHARGPFFK